MTKRSFAIRPFRAEDYPQVQDIYEQGLITGNASYEHRPLTLDEFNDGKILDTVYVAVEENDDSKVIGWVSGAHISQREVLAGCCRGFHLHRPTGPGSWHCRWLAGQVH